MYDGSGGLTRRLIADAVPSSTAGTQVVCEGPFHRRFGILRLLQVNRTRAIVYYTTRIAASAAPAGLSKQACWSVYDPTPPNALVVGTQHANKTASGYLGGAMRKPLR
jgi:hypothetical protein